MLFYPHSDVKDMDDAFTAGIMISIDRAVTPGTVTVRIGDAKPGRGEVDEKYLLEHTGSVTFSDEGNKKYSFWYYPTEGKIYWTAEKGKSDDFWTGTTNVDGRFETNSQSMSICFFSLP